MNGTASPTPPARWLPPSNHLRLHQGLWEAESVSAVSYPDAGNEGCFQVEDGSYWFQHRLDCLRTVIRRFPPTGTLYDVGGGNGFVALGLQSAGLQVALVEPGSGARNALRRGVHAVIHATMANARFHPRSLPAASAFDVVEHIADDVAFLRDIQERLEPGGRFYCTVPAFPSLWSEEDVYAGHFRRYTRRSLCAALEAAGFTVDFASYFFAWLIPPVFAFRAVPSRLKLKDKTRIGSTANLQSDHRLPAGLGGLVGRMHAWELDRLQALRPIPFGTSLLCTARANHS